MNPKRSEEISSYIIKYSGRDFKNIFVCTITIYFHIVGSWLLLLNTGV